MKVRELIEKLEQLPQELSVHFEPNWGGCGCCFSGGVPEIDGVALESLSTDGNYVHSRIFKPSDPAGKQIVYLFEG